MARIRTIKPELPQSQSVGRLSREARLLFILLFTVADDSGRARAASRLLASLLYPYDDDAPGFIGAWLNELEAEKQIRRYVIDGSEYLEIVKWLEHQKIDRPSPSRLPEYRESSSDPRESSRGLDADLGPVPSILDLGSRTAARADAQPKARALFEEFWKEYPRRDADEQRERAEETFAKLIADGVDAKVIIFNAKAYCAKVRKQNNYATRYVKVAWRWLLDQDFSGAAPVATQNEHAEPLEKDWRGAVTRWLANESNWPRWAGNAPNSPSCRCPPDILAECGVCPNTGRKIGGDWYFAVDSTDELTAHLVFAAGHKMKIKLYDVTIDGVAKHGAWFCRRYPPGFNDFGERVQSSTEDAA